MPPADDFNWLQSLYCAACFQSTGNFVGMEPLENVQPGQKQKCPTCSGTVAITMSETERKPEEE
jgi:hypothetical protein